MTKLAVLLTCFNRREKTIACLNFLYANIIEAVDLEVFLVDDGSTDGTGEAVKVKHPKVVIIKGDGNLFWNGGMRLAWESALKTTPDFYLWINDDSFIYNDAISKLLNTYENLKTNNQKVGVIIGSMVDPISKALTYGGRCKGEGVNPLKMGPILKPKKEAIRCDFINGNLTLIPRKCVETIGILNERFTHSMSDFDYGLRAANAGMSCWVAPGLYGECGTNPVEGSWQDKTLDTNERITKMQSIVQLPPVNEWIYFVRQHGGVFWPLLCLDACIRGRFPKLWLMLKRKL